MKAKNLLLIIIISMFAVSACKKSGNDTLDPTANYPKVPGSFVKSQNLSGALKGTLKQDSTYYLVGNVAVNKGDTLAVEQGATIIAKGNYQFQISGSLLCLGTEDKQITFTSSSATKFTD